MTRIISINTPEPYKFAKSISDSEQYHIQGLTVSVSRAFLDWCLPDFGLRGADVDTVDENGLLLVAYG